MGTGIRLQVLKPHRAGMTEKVHDQLTFSVIWDQAAGKAGLNFDSACRSRIAVLSSRLDPRPAFCCLVWCWDPLAANAARRCSRWSRR